MLNIYQYNCCGIDIHPKTSVATIVKTDEHKITAYQTKDVCMESTGKYQIPIFNILENTCHVIITHPKYVRAIPGKKTDKKDSILITDIFKYELVNPCFIPPFEIKQLRDLMRYRFKLLNCRTSKKNCSQNSLTMSNIMISNVVTDTFGKMHR